MLVPPDADLVVAEVGAGGWWRWVQGADVVAGACDAGGVCAARGVASARCALWEGIARAYVLWAGPRQGPLARMVSVLWEGVHPRPQQQRAGD